MIQCLSMFNTSNNACHIVSVKYTSVFIIKIYIFLIDCWSHWIYVKAMVPHSSILAWKIPWTEEPGRLQSMGVSKSRTRLKRLHFHFSLSCIGKGNGNPLQCSCLENPRMGEPDGLPSMGSHTVGYDWSDLAAAAASGSSAGKESVCNAGNPGLIPGSGPSPGEGIGYPLQYS